ncbi:hypothetical protein OK016_20885 [Vibrio chagasii]|nr:hypothetical protein [Vibrio chagasii]
MLDESGVPVMETKSARIFVESAEEREAAIKESGSRHSLALSL